MNRIEKRICKANFYRIASENAIFTVKLVNEDTDETVSLDLPMEDISDYDDNDIWEIDEVVFNKYNDDIYFELKKEGTTDLFDINELASGISYCTKRDYEAFEFFEDEGYSISKALDTALDCEWLPNCKNYEDLGHYLMEECKDDIDFNEEDYIDSNGSFDYAEFAKDNNIVDGYRYDVLPSGVIGYSIPTYYFL
jgi:hypothetical protein